jgi:hypothetical protein
LRISPPLTLEVLRRIMIFDTDSVVVIFIGVRIRSAAAIGGRTSIPSIFTPRSWRSAG